MAEQVARYTVCPTCGEADGGYWLLPAGWQRGPLELVTLTWHELVFAADVGVRRHVRAAAQGRTAVYGDPAADLWQIDIDAACAEMAVAKALNLYWEANVDPDRHGDVGHLHIRHTRRPHGSLILHDRDPDNSLFVLVIGQTPTFRIAGTLKAKDGKRPEWWQTATGRPCYMVPQDALKPVGAEIFSEEHEARQLTGSAEDV